MQASTFYGSAKRALNGWCRRAAVEPRWAGAGIPLNVVAPGVIDTPAAAWILSDPDNRAQMERLTPLSGARPGQPEQMAELIAWCVSPENALMTGQVPVRRQPASNAWRVENEHGEPGSIRDWAKAAAFIRAHGLKTVVEVSVNFVLPFAIYSYARGGLGDVGALMAASAPPILWSVVEFIRARKVDAIAVLVLTGIALSLLAFAGGGGVKFLQLRENLVTGLVGLIFLGSAAIGRPLIYQLARAGAHRVSGDPSALDGLRDDPGFRRAMTATTLAWGVGLLAACGLNCALVFMLSIKQFLLVSGPISYGAMGLLTVWTTWYVPREKRLAEARQAMNAAAGWPNPPASPTSQG